MSELIFVFFTLAAFVSVIVTICLCFYNELPGICAILALLLTFFFGYASWYSYMWDTAVSTHDFSWFMK